METAVGETLTVLPKLPEQVEASLYGVLNTTHGDMWDLSYDACHLIGEADNAEPFTPEQWFDILKTLPGDSADWPEYPERDALWRVGDKEQTRSMVACSVFFHVAQSEETTDGLLALWGSNAIAWSHNETGILIDALLTHPELPVGNSIRILEKILQGCSQKELCGYTVDEADLDKRSTESLRQLQGRLQQLRLHRIGAQVNACLRNNSPSSIPLRETHDIKDRRTRLDGLALYLSSEILDDYARTPIVPLRSSGGIDSEYPYDMIDPTNILVQNPSGIALWSVARHMRSELSVLREQGFNGYYITKEECRAHDIPDIGPRYDFFVNGAFEQPIEWFAASINGIADLYATEGKLTPEERERLTLADWALLMERPWFNEIMHSLAYTGNGIIADLGRYIKDYTPGGFAKHMAFYKLTGNMFELTGKKDEQGLPEVQLDPAFERQLRERRRPDRRCPAALMGLNISGEVLSGDYHLRSLVETGKLKRVPGSDRYNLEESAITHSLRVFTNRLKEYDRQFGTPWVASRTHEIGSVLEPPAPLYPVVHTFSNSVLASCR